MPLTLSSPAIANGEDVTYEDDLGRDVPREDDLRDDVLHEDGLSKEIPVEDEPTEADDGLGKEAGSSMVNGTQVEGVLPEAVHLEDDLTEDGGDDNLLEEDDLSEDDSPAPSVSVEETEMAAGKKSLLPASEDTAHMEMTEEMTEEMREEMTEVVAEKGGLTAATRRNASWWGIKGRGNGFNFSWILNFSFAKL